VFDGAIVVVFDGALKVEVPAIEGTRGERTTTALMPLGLFLFIYFLLQSKLLQFLHGAFSSLKNTGQSFFL